MNLSMSELLSPRYKVIADYPGNRFKIGAIFTKDIDGTYVDQDNNVTLESNLVNYPHLFQKLKWWMDRKPEEMPLFLKDIGDGKIFKVCQYDGENKVVIYRNKKPIKGWSDVYATQLEHFMPATEADHLTQKKVSNG